MATREVQGEVVLPTAGVPAKIADVAVYVEDVSRADAPSIVIGQQRQRGVSLRPGLVVPFLIKLTDESVDDRRSYSLRAHVDVGGTGDIKPGDFVSTQSYPVLTRGHGTTVRVRVKRV